MNKQKNSENWRAKNPATFSVGVHHSDSNQFLPKFLKKGIYNMLSSSQDRALAKRNTQLRENFERDKEILQRNQ